MQKVKKPWGVKCLGCGTILISKSVHDFVRFNCPNQIFADGGNEYLRFGGRDMNKIVQIPRITTEIPIPLSSQTNQTN